jgi:hypothetical protein
MNHISENRKKVVQVLNSQEYAIDEVEGSILASKFCRSSSGGVVCFLVEASPPFDKFRAWGDFSSHTDNIELDRLLNALNENLFDVIG